MTDPDVSPVAPDAAVSKADGPKNEQFAGLNRLRRERTWVDVYLIGGTCLHGQIKSFDASMMLLQTRSGDIALYHHAISTVVRAQKRGGGAKPRKRPAYESRGPQYESRSPPYEARLPRDIDPGQEVDVPIPPRRTPDRPPVVIVKQRRARTIVKPD